MVIEGRVVVGAVDSPQGQAAIRLVAERAAAGTKVTMVAFTETPGNQEDASGYRELVERRKIEAAKLGGALEAKGIEYEVRMPVGASSPGSAMLMAASEVDADLIVLGVRHRSRVGKFILGSNAQQVLLNAECPVLSIKPS